MPGELATSKPILDPLPPAYYGKFSSADTSTIGLIKELDALLTLENCDGYVFQASPYAYERAKAYIEIASGLMGGLFRSPQFVSDGEGGIDIEWANGSRKLTLSCRGNANQRDYVYWQENDEYDARDVTVSRFFMRLKWINEA